MLVPLHFLITYYCWRFFLLDIGAILANISFYGGESLEICIIVSILYHAALPRSHVMLWLSFFDHDSAGFDSRNFNDALSVVFITTLLLSMLLNWTQVFPQHLAPCYLSSYFYYILRWMEAFLFMSQLHIMFLLLPSHIILYSILNHRLAVI